VILKDFLLIEELRHWRDHYTLDKPALRAALQALGDEAAGHLRRILPSAAERYSQVIVATHVPPCREAAWYQGRPSADDYLPFFSCKAVGDVLLEAAGKLRVHRNPLNRHRLYKVSDLNALLRLIEQSGTKLQKSRGEAASFRSVLPKVRFRRVNLNLADRSAGRSTCRAVRRV